MASQKSTVVTPLAPKRQRGRLRVEAIMDAAAALFAEKGYDATTMTEIAEQASTAIGSLYRFFPNKEVLAEALLGRYWELLDEGLAEIAGRAAALTPAALADALVDLYLGYRAHRAAVIALIDIGNAGSARRSQLRAALRSRIAAILCAANPQLDAARAERMAVMVLYLLKSIHRFAEEPIEARDSLIDETRLLARLYLGQVGA
jgi:AcrR family transcriptional regulator